MRKIQNITTSSADNSTITYSELNFDAASQNSTIRTRAEPETTYAQIAVKPQRGQQNPGSEATAGKDQSQQETAGGTNSKKSRSLGLVAILIIISLFAIIIGLTVYVQQVRKRLDGMSPNASEIVRSLCTLIRNHSESLCPSGWKFHNQTCYRFSIEKVNWDTAKRECESLNSHLLIINTQQEKNFVTQSLPNKTEQYFIGLTDRQKEQNWKWVDGTPVSDSHWLPTEPNNDNNDEDCGTFAKESGKENFGCNDVPCSRQFPFICEKWALSWIGAADFEKYCL